MEKFTASEVRTESCKQGQLHRKPASDMLHAFADRLEADEKAEAVGTTSGTVDIVRQFAEPVYRLQTVIMADGVEQLPPGTKLYTHPSPSDAERLAEALRPFANLLQPHHENIPDDRPVYGINKAEITAGDLRRANEALAAHSAQPQAQADESHMVTAEEDAAVFGIGFEVDGRRVAPDRVRIFRGEQVALQTAANTGEPQWLK